MNAALLVAFDEWRYWFRSRLAWAGLVVVGSLVVCVAVLTAVRMSQEATERHQSQQAAQERFLSQPDRHPHRMVHYGHYVFRQPGPLSMIDPGVDGVTGTSLFLEGHRQNTATFSSAQAGANTGGLGLLNTALMYQVLIPLLLIALGHGLFVRERETQTLTSLMSMGLSVKSLALGKGLALLVLVVVLMLPLVALTVSSVFLGEPATTAVSLLLAYLAYLSTWAFAVFLASLLSHQRRSTLALLFGGWFLVTLLLPRVGGVLARAGDGVDGHIEQTLRTNAELRKAGDPHDPADPAFAKLRKELLAKYGVESVDALPVNVRGVVASAGEERSAKILRRNSEQRMNQESTQSSRWAGFGWLSPAVAIAMASQALAGTDLSTHHRFLREGEETRLEFVQALNRLHATELAYADDTRRSSDPAAEQRTRISSENWALLQDFEFKLGKPNARIARASSSLPMIFCWATGLFVLCFLRARRLKP